MEQIPFVAYESTMTRLERTNKRSWILCIILLVVLLVTNIGWMVWETQWQYVDTESTEISQEVDQTTDGGGDNTFIGGDYNGTTDNTDNN